MDKSTPTTSGCDSETGSVDDIPADDPSDLSKDISDKMTAASNYVGFFFSASSWSSANKSPSSEETDDKATENSVTKSISYR